MIALDAYIVYQNDVKHDVIQLCISLLGINYHIKKELLTRDRKKNKSNKNKVQQKDALNIIK
jgi:hypothetical protein